MILKLVSITAAAAMGTVNADGSRWDLLPPGTITMFPAGKCGDGENAYYGLLQPAKLTHPNKFFIEIMGGAVCFNEASCRDYCLSDWMGIERLGREKLGVPENMISLLTSGASIPLSMLASLPSYGYLPVDDDHPMAGRRGVFFPSCTGDINMGNNNLTYSYVPPTPIECGSEEVVGDGTGYRGCTARTRSGRSCQKWSAQSPHKHANVPCRNLDAGLWGDHNYCRNPDREDTIWCYTTDPDERWEFCDPGNFDVTPVNRSSLAAFHHGAKNFYDLLSKTHREFPDFDHIAMYGGSGGAVATAAWLPMLADMWPSAQVTGLADSGLHILPGTKLFEYFYEQAQWGPGTAGQAAPAFTDLTVPDFDWRRLDAIASHLASYDGRISLAYVSCINDWVVMQDRYIMAQYTQLPESITALTNWSRQHDETWSFLTNLHTCAPQGSVYSYVLDCTNHHHTLNGGFPVSGLEGTISVKSFVENVLRGEVPSQDDPDRTRFWFEQHEVRGDDGACLSEVRRRRVPSKTAPASTSKEESVASSSCAAGVAVVTMMFTAACFII